MNQKYMKNLNAIKDDGKSNEIIYLFIQFKDIVSFSLLKNSVSLLFGFNMNTKKNSKFYKILSNNCSTFIMKRH